MLGGLDFPTRAFRGRKLSSWDISTFLVVVIGTLIIVLNSARILETITSIATKGYTPIVIGASSLVAFMGVMISIYLGRKTSKDRETISYLMHRSGNSRLEASLRRLMNIAEQREGMKIATLATENKNSLHRMSIKRVLSHHEVLATGVNNHIYNEKMLMDASLTRVVHLFNTTHPYIRKIRKTQASAYCEFEEMAKRWKVERDRRSV